MRPGPRRACAIANPLPSSSSRFDTGTRTLSNVISQCPCWSCQPNTGSDRSIDTPGVSTGHQDHRLLLMAGGVGVGPAHHDEDLAARVGGTGDPPLATVDDVVAAVAQHGRLDVAGVAGCHRGLGHRERAADLAVQQRLEPLLALLLGGEQVQGLHVAGVRGGAVGHLGRRSPCSSRSTPPAARTPGSSGPRSAAGTDSTGRAPWPGP